ncbi:MAG: phosphoadenylyl-sulfate reductase [Acidobacteria bacterium]|nr:MAG: phosphoadenylyl-sulfate reductase [Acidobacteriota bacterium]
MDSRQTKFEETAARIEDAFKLFDPSRVALASSFGAEDQVLTDLLARSGQPVRFFTLDTGRQFEDTYRTMERTIERYGIRFQVFAPDTGELEKLIAERGPNLFYSGIDHRKACCQVRKLNPLARVLSGLAAWICGLRRDQSVTRNGVEAISWDAEHGLHKVCPLFDWSEDDVWSYIRLHAVPYNLLHDKGFKSIGCEPCTRATRPGEDIRAGRWWWESPEHKECGLHAAAAGVSGV